MIAEPLAYPSEQDSRQNPADRLHGGEDADHGCGEAKFLYCEQDIEAEREAIESRQQPYDQQPPKRAVVPQDCEKLREIGAPRGALPSDGLLRLDDEKPRDERKEEESAGGREANRVVDREAGARIAEQERDEYSCADGDEATKDGARPQNSPTSPCRNRLGENVPPDNRIDAEGCVHHRMQHEEGAQAKQWASPYTEAESDRED